MNHGREERRKMSLRNSRLKKLYGILQVEADRKRVKQRD